MENKTLVYVNPIGINNNDEYEYDFYFSDTPDIVWGANWEITCPSACGDLKPEESTYTDIIRVTSPIKFFCAQENSCFSMQDCIDGVIALCFVDLNVLDSYPDPYRIVFPFATPYDVVKEKLASQDIEIEELTSETD